MRRLVTLVIFSSMLAFSGAVDQTLIAGASGYGVVEAVINLIRENCVFAHDKLLLRRLAYVLTADGGDPSTYRPGYNGGIWAVDESMFQQTKSGGSTLDPLYMLILHSFGIDWHRVGWSELRKPLYSGLAAALYIKLKTGSTGVAWPVEDQAKFVSNYYATSITANAFETKANLLDLGCDIPEEIDLVFIIDDSSSLGNDDFQRMISFLESVVDEFRISSTETQVAVVEFDTHAKVKFYLNQHTSINDLKNAIKSIHYEGGSTNTAEAITLAVNEVFSMAKGSRPVAKKVVVLITDGHSNDAIDTHHAADLLHREGIATFSIGVGNISISELNEIATDPDCTHVSSITHYSEIKFMKNEIQKSSCEAPLYTNKTVTCEAGKCPTVAFPVSSKGLTVKTTITCGEATVYSAFKTPRPGPAYYEIKQSLNPTHTSTFYVTDHGPNIFVHVGDVNLALSGSGVVKCMVTMTPCQGDCTKHEVHVICEDNGVYRNCTRDDLKGRCGDDWSFKNPCTLEHVSKGQIRFPYPGYNNKFILCDHAGGGLIVSCPPNTQYIQACGYCVPTNEITILPCATMSFYNSTNPCTAYNLFMGRFDYPYAADNTKYIHCDVWGYPWLMRCPSGQVWDQGHQSCMIPTHFINPCPTKGKISGERYWPDPTDCHKYIECDRYFKTYWIRPCPGDEIWHDALKTCDANPGNILGCV